MSTDAGRRAPGAAAAPDTGPPPRRSENLDVARIVEITDERGPIADAALGLIEAAFEPPDRQPVSELRSEVAEKRLQLLTAYDFHLLTALDAASRPIGTIAGVYLAGVNAGFVTYLTVLEAHRGRRIARQLRRRLVETFRTNARQAGHEELNWVLGEVRADNSWLRGLVRHRGAIPFDLGYFHPGMIPGVPHDRYVLYRQPVGDARVELPASLVRRILFVIYRRAYRVRYPLEREAFRAMLAQLEDREMVGMHREWRQRPGAGQ